jgi:hypothetical protein
MVYVTNDGRVLESRPLSLASIADFFWGFVNFFVLFFRSLFNPVIIVLLVIFKG